MNTEAADRRFVRTAWNVASISRSASGKKLHPALEVFCGEGRDVALDDIAGALEVERKSQDGFEAAVFVVGHAVRVEARHVALDLAIEGVEDVVQAPSRRDRLPIPPAQGVRGALDHRVQDIDHAEHLSCGVAERDGGRFRRRFVEIERPGGRCHVIETTTRSAISARNFKRPPRPRATCSSPRCVARGVIELT